MTVGILLPIWRPGLGVYVVNDVSRQALFFDFRLFSGFVSDLKFSFFLFYFSKLQFILFFWKVKREWRGSFCSLRRPPTFLSFRYFSSTWRFRSLLSFYKKCRRKGKKGSWVFCFSFFSFWFNYRILYFIIFYYIKKYFIPFWAVFFLLYGLDSRLFYGGNAANGARIRCVW